MQAAAAAAAVILNQFTCPSARLTEHPYKTDTHLYATDNRTIISINKNSITDTMDHIQYNTNIDSLDKFYNITSISFDNQITISDAHIFNLLNENISQCTSYFSDPVTRLLIDTQFTNSVEIETHELSFIGLPLNDYEYSLVNLFTHEGHCTVSTIEVSKIVHTYIKTSELSKILYLFSHSDKLSISFNSETSHIKFSSDTIQAITLPYAAHDHIGGN